MFVISVPRSETGRDAACVHEFNSLFMLEWRTKKQNDLFSLFPITKTDFDLDFVY